MIIAKVIFGILIGVENGIAKWTKEVFVLCGKEQTMNKEMQRLRVMLDAEHIKWEDKSNMGIYPICRTHFRYKGQRWSVIHGYGTYGGYDPCTDTDRGLLEAYNFSGDPKGYLTAEEVMQYVRGVDNESS